MSYGSRLRPSFWISLALSSSVAVACGSFSTECPTGGTSCEAPPNTLKDASSHPFLSADAGSFDARVPTDSGPPIDPLCGRVGVCRSGIPDDPLACVGFGGDGGVTPSDGGLLVDAGRESGASRDSSLDGSKLSDSSPPSARDASAEGSLPSNFAEGGAPPGHPLTDGGATRNHLGFLDAPPPYEPTPDVDTGYSCQVGASNNGEPWQRCARAGSGKSGDPCSAGSDCLAGLACVAEESTGDAATRRSGRCHPYCCRNKECKEPLTDGGLEPTFCAPRPLLDGDGPARLLVPVCVPVDHCSLDDPYPCPRGQACKCTGEMACAVVDYANATTACVRPGKGRSGDACSAKEPCAWGYLCSSTGVCLKQCRTGVDDGACSPGMCQLSAGLPTGWGLCEGPAPLAR